MGSNILASATGTITEIEKGEKGAVERPRSWDDIADGSSIESGSDGEKWLDIVLYGDNWYQCIKSFTKGNGVVPSNTIYFKNITDYKRLATGLFLASKAYIHNLGVDNILITDQGEGKGNVLLKADKDGITCNQGNFKDVTVSGTVNATSGEIGGFKISGNGLTNNGMNNDSYIIFRNDNVNCFAGIGGNVLPGSTGLRAVARFENEDKTDQWLLGRNIAMLLSAKNGTFNFAFTGTGNGILNGAISGYAVETKEANKQNTCFMLEPTNALTFYVNVSQKDAAIGLPSLTWMRSFLGIGADINFSVTIDIIIASSNAWNGTMIYGRTDKVKGMNTTDYPSVTWSQDKKNNYTDGNEVNTYYFNRGLNRIVLSYINGSYYATPIVTSIYNYSYDVS